MRLDDLFEKKRGWEDMDDNETIIQDPEAEGLLPIGSFASIRSDLFFPVFRIKWYTDDASGSSSKIAYLDRLFPNPGPSLSRTDQILPLEDKVREVLGIRDLDDKALIAEHLKGLKGERLDMVLWYLKHRYPMHAAWFEKQAQLS